MCVTWTKTGPLQAPKSRNVAIGPVLGRGEQRTTDRRDALHPVLVM
jgi:hypothetical protein